MTKSGYERLKEYRLRQSMGEQLPKCKMCDRPLKGLKSIERGVCSYCYPKTEMGRIVNKASVEKHSQLERQNPRIYNAWILAQRSAKSAG